MQGSADVMIVHNVEDRRRQWIGSWDTAPLDYDKLEAKHVGATVIYQPSGRWQKMCPAQAGTLSSFRDGMVFVRYTQGDTAAATMARHCLFGIRPLDGPVASP